MKISFLGTGTSQGVPVIGCNCNVCRSLDYRDKRLRTSIHIEINGKSFIIDSGPDFRQQVLRANIQHLDALIFTHQHKDHTAGMDDVRSFNFKQDMDMPIYARPEVITQLKQEFSYVFNDEGYPGIPRVEVNEIDNLPFSIDGITITPIEVMHFKLAVLGFRFGDFTYITDANYIAPEEMEKIKGSAVLVINALQINKHISHFNLEEAIEMIEIIQPKKAYLTHISHKLGLHDRISKQLPSNIELAWDGLEIQL